MKTATAIEASVTYPVFDTNIVIDWLKRYRQAADEIALYSQHRISRVTWAEVLAGEPPVSRDRAAQLIGNFEIIELDDQIASVAAEIRFNTRISCSMPSSLPPRR